MGVLTILRYVMFVIVILGIVGLGALLFMDNIKTKGKDLKSNLGKLKKDDKKANVKDNKSKSKEGKKGEVKLGYTQDTLPFKSIEVYSPDQPTGLVLKNDGNTFVGVIEVYGTNYNLLDLEEREQLEKGFEVLLNGIDYPIQLFILSKKIDIENYTKKYNDRISDLKKQLVKTMDKINFYNQSKNNTNNEELMELEEKKIRQESQYSYGVQLENYIINRCKQSNMLERRYYIVISHSYNPSKFKEELTEEEIKSNAFFDINNRSSSLIGALQRFKLNGKLLTGEELVELLYVSCNKDDSNHYRLENAMNTRFSHLYTTSEAVEIKAMKRRLKELEKNESILKKEINDIQKGSDTDEYVEEVGA